MAVFGGIPTIFPVTCHTDHVGPGSTFVAIKGFKHDGAQYIESALQKGATTIVVHNDVDLNDVIQQAIIKKNAQLMRVADTRKALAQLSAHALGHPAKKLRIIGITGTKGKTTSSFLLSHIFKQAKIKTALLSTVHNEIDGQVFATQLTTQQPDYLHMFFKCCVDAGVEVVVMEVAAQALSLHRTYGIEFDGALFTNFSLEHLEFYATMEDYFVAKCLLFGQCKQDAPILINVDDAKGRTLLDNNPTYQSFGITSADVQFRAAVESLFGDAVQCTIAHDKERYAIVCPALFGMYNAYNILGACSMAYLLGVNTATIVRALHAFPSIPGRLERYTLPNGAHCIIDYAHNPASYKAVLSTLRSITNHLIVVFGAGGQRDAQRRPLMGAAAAEFADLIILTADNPRTEDPYAIMDDIVIGIDQKYGCTVIREVDRERAIKRAYQHSKPDSIIAILGKGPDAYQIIGTQKTYFSDAGVVRLLR